MITCLEKLNVSQGKEKRIPVPVPSLFLKRPCDGEKMAGTNEYAFFAVDAYVPGRAQNQAEQTQTNAFRPVPVPKSTFQYQARF